MMKEAIDKTDQVVKDENEKEKDDIVLLTNDDIKQIIQTIIDYEKIDEKDAFFMKWTDEQWNKLAWFLIKQAEKYEQSDATMSDDDMKLDGLDESNAEYPKTLNIVRPACFMSLAAADKDSSQRT
ncbi:unnamed protein product [Ambrosiozyma monospora]|uniref:Unnamed protein product n=1 Tax=Ambrosiozyma monospora TaxID=43982 RepID=A0A9W6YY90_AMBMO|nr:unnamed protein product [Ambrosiozyma monospora]